MRKRFPVEEDPAGVSQAVREFNSHEGPARIFYNRNSRTFFTRLYPDGGDRWFGPMTSDFPDVKVTDTELRVLESEIGQYAVW